MSVANSRALDMGRVRDLTAYRFRTRYGENAPDVEIFFDAPRFAYRVSVKSRTTNREISQVFEDSVFHRANGPHVVELAVQELSIICDKSVFDDMVLAALKSPVERARYKDVCDKIRMVKWSDFQINDDSIVSLDLGNGHRWSIRKRDLASGTDNLLALLFMLED